jgi:hypothetical protein
MRTRFCMVDGKPRTLTNRVLKVNGTHRGYRMLFGPSGLKDVIPDRQWRKMLLAGRVNPFPVDEKIEQLSDRIGGVPDGMDKEPLTPQDALNRALAHARYLSVTDADEAEVRHE